jgi:hypothetical protein
MKLSVRKKTILLGSILLTLLAVIVIIVLSSKEKGVSSVHSQNELSLKQAQVISEIQNFLDSKNIKKVDLLTKLKEQRILKPNETDWKKCFDNADNSNELNTLKKNVLAIVNNLSNVPFPNDSPEWERILREINTFIESKPSNLKDIEDWVKTQSYPDPLERVDLAGVDKEKLTVAEFGQNSLALSELSQAKKGAERYKTDYIPLEAKGDGNCFLNSFSILLAGQDRVLALPLRVKICLELMTNKDFTDGSDSDRLNEIINKVGNDFSVNGRWLALDDITYMCQLLSRPVILVYRPDTSGWDPSWNSYQELQETGGFSWTFYPSQEPNPLGNPTINGFKKPPQYNEPFVIYHVGGCHFIPLVKK